MKENNFESKFIDLTHLIKKEFDRNIDLHGDRIKCIKGCSDCCSRVFRITPADAFIIRKYLMTVPETLLNKLKEKSVQYINNANEQINKKNLKSPCPALDEDGACLIYGARPVICRRFGPPVYDYKDPRKLFACELNFADGEEIIDPELINEQTKIGMLWDKLKTDFNIENNIEANTSTSVAEVISMV